MPEKVMPGPVEGTGGIREAVCVHTRKIYDSDRKSTRLNSSHNA